VAGPERRTSLVVSRDAARRRDWGRELEREGVGVVRCAARKCPLLVGGVCDVLGGADAAVYDEETLGPELFLGLARARLRPTVLFARDVPRDGHHHAKFTRVLDHRGAATIFPHLR
jgi:hypothetical protein